MGLWSRIFGGRARATRAEGARVAAEVRAAVARGEVDDALERTRVALMKQLAAEAGRDFTKLEVAPQFIVRVAKTRADAIRAFEKDKFIQAALGPHISNHIIEAKKAEWQEYIGQVHPWELDRYLAYY